MADDDNPVVKPAKNPASDPSKSAAFIFLHRLDDDAHGWTNVADQFQAATKLPHLEWIFPNAPENRDAMQRAWFTPTRLSPSLSARPELDDPEDADAMTMSLRTVENMIDDVVAKGVPAERIVLGGFSPRLRNDASGRLGIKMGWKAWSSVGLSRFMPQADRIKGLR